jgi:hypothetical protein
VSTSLTLTAQQLTFMLKHHVEIEIALIPQMPPIDTGVITDLVNSEEYRSAFGTMLWDDAYDRYQDMPEYDWRLRKLLRFKLFAEDPVTMPWSIEALQKMVNIYEVNDAFTISREELLKLVEARLSELVGE